MTQTRPKGVYLRDRDGRKAFTLRHGPGGLVVATLASVENERHTFFHVPPDDCALLRLRLAEFDDSTPVEFELKARDSSLLITLEKGDGYVRMLHETSRGSDALRTWCLTTARHLHEALCIVLDNQKEACHEP